MSKKYIDSLDGIRGIACILIAFFFHYCLNNSTRAIAFIGRCGENCVVVFFMISGLTMALNYRDKIEKIGGAFVYKRLRRIYPTYWITLCFAIVGYTFFSLSQITYADIQPWYADTSILGVVKTVLGVHNGWIGGATIVNAPAWFVSVLLLDYLIYYFIASLKKMSYKIYIFANIIWLMIGLYGIFMRTEVPFLYADTSCRGYASFSMGVLLYEVYQRLDDYENLRVLGLILGVLFFITILYCYKYGFDIALSGQVVFTNVIYLSPLLIGTCIYNKFVRKLLSTGIFRYFGKISMNIFLFHWGIKLFMIAIGDKAEQFKYGTLANYFIYVVFTVIIATVYTYKIEPVVVLLFDKICNYLLCMKKD